MSDAGPKQDVLPHDRVVFSSDAVFAILIAPTLVLLGMLVAGTARGASGPGVSDPPVAGSACDGATVLAVARHLGSRVDGPAAPVAHTCKAWPFDPSITLAAIAWSRSPAEVMQGERQLELVIGMLSSTGQVLAAYGALLQEDASLELAENSLRLDTARYDLAPGRRAFGVVVDSVARGASCPDRRFERELTLYLREGEALKPVLATYLQTDSFEQGSPCAWGQPLVVDTARTTLHIAGTRHNGLADVILQADIERSRRDADGNALAEDRRTARRTLRYDGNAYQTDPFENLFFWAGGANRD